MLIRIVRFCLTMAGRNVGLVRASRYHSALHACQLAEGHNGPSVTLIPMECAERACCRLVARQAEALVAPIREDDTGWAWFV